MRVLNCVLTPTHDENQKYPSLEYQNTNYIWKDSFFFLTVATNHYTVKQEKVKLQQLFQRQSNKAAGFVIVLNRRDRTGHSESSGKH